MTELSYKRCFNHVDREAAARCPECRQFFCRECVTEHEDRVLCTRCLAKMGRAGIEYRSALAKVTRAVQLVVGIGMAWLFFFLIGETLARLPDSFHEDAVWQVPWTGAE